MIGKIDTVKIAVLKFMCRFNAVLFKIQVNNVLHISKLILKFFTGYHTNLMCNIKIV